MRNINPHRTQLEIALETAGYHHESVEDTLIRQQERNGWLEGDEDLSSLICEGLYQLAKDKDGIFDPTSEAGQWIMACQEEPDILAELFDKQHRNYN